MGVSYLKFVVLILFLLFTRTVCAKSPFECSQSEHQNYSITFAPRVCGVLGLVTPGVGQRREPAILC